ncbi:unnamed protein product [Agarophyton chilense]
MVQLSPTIKTVAGSCRLRNMKAYIMLCMDQLLLPGTHCSGGIVLGDPFLVHSSLDVKEFIASIIDHLYFIEYGALDQEESSVKIVKVGIRLLTE